MHDYGRKKKKHEPQQINYILHTDYSNLTAKIPKNHYICKYICPNELCP